MTWWIWILAGLGVLLLELVTPGGFYFLFFGASAIAVGVLAATGVASDWVQLLVFSVLSVTSLLVFRGPLLRRLKATERNHGPVDSLVGLSPGNTDPSLTIGEDHENPARQFDNYFRLVATDAEQGPFLATYAVAGLGATTAAVVSETKPVSKGLADDFTAGFTGGGGEVVYRETVPDGTTDFTDVVTALGELDAPPDLLFFGGEYTVAATYRDATAAAGIDAPLMGGDGIKDDAFITDAGEASVGSIASTVGVPLNALTTAAEFVAAYDAAGFEDPATDFGPYAYDAANLLIDASAEALADSEVVTAEARADVITQLDAIETDGVTGAIAFDDYGDTTTKVFTIYRVEGDAWVPVGGYIGFEL
jgi:branched-chain amino acid transport system substrate-binding protein